MFKTTTTELFKVYSMVKNILDLDNELSEITVNQGQIILECSNMVEFAKFDALRVFVGRDPDDITTFEDKLFIGYRYLNFEEDGLTDEVKLLLNTINEISNYVCKCPILEFRLANEYIKVYLDKPNIKIKDIATLDEIFTSEGVLQTGEQRPYVLYIKD